MKLNRSSMLYGTMLLTFAGLANQLLGFVYRILLSRLIGAQVMGLYQLIMPVYAVLLSISAVGLTSAVSTLTSEYQALENRKATLQVLYRGLTVMVGLLSIPTAVVFLCSDGISVHILGDARTQLGLILLLPCILLTGIENMHKHAFYGIGVIRPPACVELLEQLVRTVAVLGMLVLFLPQNPERTVGIIVVGMVLCEVFSATTLAILYRRHHRKLGPLTGRGVQPHILNKKLSSVAVPITCTALLANVMGSICAIIIPQKLVASGMSVEQSISSFGVLFGMSIPLLTLPTAFIGALGLVLVPKLVESTALGDTHRVKLRISKAMLATSVLMLPALALLVVLGPTIGSILFNEATVGNYLTPLACSVAIGCYQSVLSCSLNGVGKQPSAAKIALLTGAVQLILVVLLVGLPQVGLLGYVIASISSTLLGVVLSMISVWRWTGLKPELFHWLTAPGLSALLMGLVTNLLFHTLVDRGMSELLAVLPCCIFGLFLYLVTLHVQGIRLRKLFHISRS